VSEQFGEGVTVVFNFEAALANRAAIGGTAPEALALQLQAAKLEMRKEPNF
jgi:hypothetical protein